MTTRNLLERRGEGRRHALHLLLDRRGLRQSRIRCRCRSTRRPGRCRPTARSKLMTEIMLHDAAAAHGMNYVVLRYFNVAGADPQARIGLATVGATHLLKIAVEAATGQRAKIDVFGTDYPTPDGSCIRDFIHVSDLAQAHRAALSYLRGGGGPTTLNCGYGRGYSVLETIEAVRRVSGRNFAVQYRAAPAGRHHDHGRRHQPHPRDAGLDAAIRRSRNHRGARAGLGREARSASAQSAQHCGTRAVSRLKSSFGASCLIWLEKPGHSGQGDGVSLQPLTRGRALARRRQWNADDRTSSQDHRRSLWRGDPDPPPGDGTGRGLLAALSAGVRPDGGRRRRHRAARPICSARSSTRPMSTRTCTASRCCRSSPS